MVTAQDKKNILSLGFISLCARSVQALLPLIIVWRYGTTAETDFYFYWVSQCMLMATFVTSVWPALYVPFLVKLKDNSALLSQASGKVFLQCIPSVLICALFLSLASTTGLWGGTIVEDKKYFLLLLGLSMLSSCLAIIMDQIATVHRKFGLYYIIQISAVVGQVVILFSDLTTQALLHSFLGFSFIQFIGGILILIKYISFSGSNIPLNNAPSFRELLYVYGGSIFTMLVGHVSYRLMHNYGEGIVSAYALAQMAVNLPQQLIVSQMSAVAGISLADTASNTENEQRWKRLLSISSLTSALALVIIALLISMLYTSSKFLVVETTAMIAILSVPLAVSGLNTWVARMLMAQRKIEIGTKIQLVFQISTLLLLAICSITDANYLIVISCFALISLLYFCSVHFLLRYFSHRTIG